MKNDRMTFGPVTLHVLGIPVRMGLDMEGSLRYFLNFAPVLSANTAALRVAIVVVIFGNLARILRLQNLVIDDNQ